MELTKIHARENDTHTSRGSVPRLSSSRRGGMDAYPGVCIPSDRGELVRHVSPSYNDVRVLRSRIRRPKVYRDSDVAYRDNGKSRHIGGALGITDVLARVCGGAPAVYLCKRSPEGNSGFGAHHQRGSPRREFFTGDRAAVLARAPECPGLPMD